MHSLLKIAQKPPYTFLPPTLLFPAIGRLVRKKTDNVQQGLIMCEDGKDIRMRVKLLHLLNALLRTLDIGIHGFRCQVERLSSTRGVIFRGGFTVVKTVKGGEKGTRANVWVDMGKRRRGDALRQREVRGGPELPAVMNTIAAEEYKSRWRGGDAAEGTHVSGGVLK